MTDQLVLPSTPAEGVRVLALNRPSKRNALSQELITEFLGQLKTASNDDGVRAMQMILLGRPIPAEEAMSVGLVAQLYESGTVLDNV
ncbi:hypothetical protein ACLX1H_000477 [Fusarium chlamydosporum]